MHTEIESVNAELSAFYVTLQAYPQFSWKLVKYGPRVLEGVPH